MCFKSNLANPIDFELEKCSETKNCNNCIFYKTWTNLKTSKEKKIVLNSLLYKNSNRFNLKEFEVKNFQRVAMLNCYLDFVYCKRCKKIFNFNDKKE